MYQRILVPVEHSPYDDVILDHVRKLARTCNDASIVLIHVADGWAARNINQLDLRESEEMKSDREYIEAIADALEQQGYQAEAILAGGDPAKEIPARRALGILRLIKSCHQVVVNVPRSLLKNRPPPTVP